MKQIVFLVLLICCAGSAFSQVETPLRGPRPYEYLNSIQLELLGSGVAYSLNYERILLNGRIFKTGIRAGAGVVNSIPGEGRPQVRIPLMVNGQISFGRHHTEVGAGVALLNSYNFVNSSIGFSFDSFRIFGALSAGYRYQKPESRLILKLAYTPLINLYRGRYVQRVFHSIGATVGYAF